MFDLKLDELLAMIEKAKREVTLGLIAMAGLEPPTKPHRLAVWHNAKWMTIAQRKADRGF